MYKYSNENPLNRYTDDCVIRAISVATGKSWDETLDELVEIAHEVKTVPNNRDCYEVYLQKNGFIRCKQPRKDDNTKYRGWEFLDKIKKDDIILCHIGTHHIVAVKNKKIWDIWDCSYDCVGIYWIKSK